MWFGETVLAHESASILQISKGLIVPQAHVEHQFRLILGKMPLKSQKKGGSGDKSKSEEKREDPLQALVRLLRVLYGVTH